MNKIKPLLKFLGLIVALCSYSIYAIFVYMERTYVPNNDQVLKVGTFYLLLIINIVVYIFGIGAILSRMERDENE